MALSNEDIEAFVTELRNNADLRDRIRAIILSDEFLRLPMYVYETREITEQTREETRAALTALADAIRDLQRGQADLQRGQADLQRGQADLQRGQADLQRGQADLQRGQVELTAAINALTTRLAAVEGRMGTFEGWRYETNLRLNYTAHFGTRYRGMTLLTLGDHPPIDDAYADGRITHADWVDLHRIDLAVLARRRDPPDPEPLVLMAEISMTVDGRDVARAHARAQILVNAGVPARGVVCGQRILRDAAVAAESLGVDALIDRRDAEPADDDTA